MTPLKDIESFIVGRMKLMKPKSRAWYAYRDVLFLVRQHIKAEEK